MLELIKAKAAGPAALFCQDVRHVEVAELVVELADLDLQSHRDRSTAALDNVHDHQCIVLGESGLVLKLAHDQRRYVIGLPWRLDWPELLVIDLLSRALERIHSDQHYLHQLRVSPLTCGQGGLCVEHVVASLLLLLGQELLIILLSGFPLGPVFDL